MNGTLSSWRAVNVLADTTVEQHATRCFSFQNLWMWAAANKSKKVGSVSECVLRPNSGLTFFLSPIIMEVENYPKWKETNIGETHFRLPWLWEERNLPPVTYFGTLSCVCIYGLRVRSCGTLKIRGSSIWACNKNLSPKCRPELAWSGL